MCESCLKGKCKGEIRNAVALISRRRLQAEKEIQAALQSFCDDTGLLPESVSFDFSVHRSFSAAPVSKGVLFHNVNLTYSETCN